MFNLSIDPFCRLYNRAVFRIHPEEIEHLEATLNAKMYAPCGNPQIDHEPTIRTADNILRIVHVKKVEKELIKWKASGKLWIIRKNQKGMDVMTSVETAIVLFEICEASNHAELLRLKGNLQTHLAESFNIHLESTKLIL